MTAKQIKYFGTKSQRAALSRRRSTSSGVRVMAKRRRSSSTRGRVVRYAKRSGKNIVSNAVPPLVGGAIYGVTDPIISSVPMLGSMPGKLILGAIASTQGGVIKDTGKAILSVEAYKFTGGFAGQVGAAISAYVN